MNTPLRLFFLFLTALCLAVACDDGSPVSAPTDNGTVDSDVATELDTADEDDSELPIDTTEEQDSHSELDAPSELEDDSQLPPQLSEPFLFGINVGNPKPEWGDAKTASLAAAAGCNSSRPKLPEHHLERWGYEIEVNDMKSYAADGLHELTAFVTGPSRAHSTIPAAEPDWKVDYYIPANLHEPIWLSEGVVNPANYWAAFLFQTMSTYGEWVQYWEIWNEPDWVGDWRVSESWWEQPPSANDLPRFNGSIFDYVRMLRIAWEVKRVVAPHTWIAVGGLGYPSFLDAILRYSDNPDDGSVDPAHPFTGAQYFEVVSFHHYPHLSGSGNSDAAARGLIEHKARFQAVLDAHATSAKRWIVTESGAAGSSIAGVPSGPEYARNYLWKAWALAQADGIDGIHWFILNQSQSSSTDPFVNMGLYHKLGELSEPQDAQLTDTGVAHKTLANLLRGAQARLDSPIAQAGVSGVCYRLASGKQAWMLWAEGSDEAASAAYELQLESSDVQTLSVYSWDHSRSGQTQQLQVQNRKATIALGSSPVLVVED